MLNRSFLNLYIYIIRFIQPYVFILYRYVIGFSKDFTLGVDHFFKRQAHLT